MITRHLILLLASLTPLLSLAGAAPSTLTGLQERFIQLDQRCRPAVVGIHKADEGDGTGVIVSPDGLILSAAHVVDRLGDEIQLYLSDGQRAKAEVIGINHRSDTALCQITTNAPKGGWPYRPLRSDEDLKPGNWCLIISNGGGIQLDRPAPLKVGRILKSYRDINRNLLTSDCTAVNGDSGGPLFDLEGNVAGVNSTILLKDIRHNSHISSQTILSQWQAELSGKKPLLNAARIKEHRAMQRLAMGVTGNLTDPATRRFVVKSLKRKFTSLPNEALEALADVTTFKNNKISIHANERTEAILSANGIDAKNVGITIIRNPDALRQREIAWLTTRFGPLPEAVETFLLARVERSTRHALTLPLNRHDLANLKELNFDPHAAQMDQLLRFRFAHLSEHGKQLIRDTVSFSESGPVITADLFTGDELAQLGINPGRQKVSKQERDMLVLHRFTARYGKDNMTSEVRQLLLKGFVGYEKSTATFSTDFTAEETARLAQSGILLNAELGAPTKVLAPVYGDSAHDVQALMPKLPAPVLLHQDGQQIGLVTPVDSQFAVSKSSLLLHNRLLEIEYQGKILPATVHAHDPISDLVLLHCDHNFAVPDWQTATAPPRGTIVLSGTKAQPSLGVISVPQQSVPDRPKALQPRKDGAPANYFSQQASAFSGTLSPRRTDLPECLYHDAITFNDDCGGPLYDIEGQVMGINIAHFSRTTNYALSKASVDAALTRLKASPKPRSPIQTAPADTHVFLWLGGTNMVGRTALTAEDGEPLENAYQLKQFGSLSWTPLTAEIERQNGKQNFSPMTAFAKAYRKQHPTVTICIVPIASPIALPTHYQVSGKSLAPLLARYRFLQNEGTLKAILWQGGESSFYSESRSKNYAEDVASAVAAIRQGVANPTLPLYFGGPHPHFGQSDDPQRAQAHARFWGNLDKIKASIPHTTLISTTGLTALEDKNKTSRFLSRAATIKLGERFADAVIAKPF